MFNLGILFRGGVHSIPFYSEGVKLISIFEVKFNSILMRGGK